jgi:hypothetical protein
MEALAVFGEGVAESGIILHLLVKIGPPLIPSKGREVSLGLRTLVG